MEQDVTLTAGQIVELRFLLELRIMELERRIANSDWAASRAESQAELKEVQEMNSELKETLYLAGRRCPR